MNGVDSRCWPITTTEPLLRIQEVLRVALKITDKFLHDDNTLGMPPLRKDVEYVYFTTAHAVSQLIGSPRI